MKSLFMVSAIVVSGFVNPAVAGCGNAPSTLTGAQVTTILTNNFACGQSSALNAPGWNERHSGGRIIEQHEGGLTTEDVGSFAVSEVAGRGRVTYSYGGGNTPVYEIAVVANGNCNNPAGGCTIVPATYQFCGVGGGAPATLNILVSAAAPALGTCPANP
jgi:transcription elongation factor